MRYVWLIEMLLAGGLAWWLHRTGYTTRVKSATRLVAVLAAVAATALMESLPVGGGFDWICFAFVVNLLVAGFIAFTSAWLAGKLARGHKKAPPSGASD
jgi:hypothetical protein